MPIQIPSIDDRTYEELLAEALARIPVHTPEWSNFSKSDPGVTLVEVFAFLTDSLLYRAKQIPERNRLKFLSLLGVHLAPGASARGIVQILNERREAVVAFVAAGAELLAGKVPFRTEQGLFALPLEGQVYYKRRLTGLDDDTRTYFEEQYHDLIQQGQTLDYYEATPLGSSGGDGTDLSGAVDGALWIALLVPPGVERAAMAAACAGKVLSVGVVPVVSAEALSALGTWSQAGTSTWRFQVPRSLGANRSMSMAYDTLTEVPAPIVPTVIELRLPDAGTLAWELPTNVYPGIDQQPPTLEDREQNDRLLTWIRVSSTGGDLGRVLWLGTNVVGVTQRSSVRGERLADGNGEPDQVGSLARRPVIAESVRVTVDGEPWERIDDLIAAGPEVVVPDPRLPPGVKRSGARPSRVFTLDPEAGRVHFGDGLHGARPPRGVVIRIDYDHGVGAAGNLVEGSLRAGPTLQPGLKVVQPVRTWGGADAETVRDGEKHIARHLQHRDRLVTTADFDAICRRTPGVAIGRVEVLPAWHPEWSSAGYAEDAPGVVTLMVIPASDPRSPETPEPDTAFLRAVAEFLLPRRLVTTELLLRGPRYKPVWVSVGVRLVAGASVASARSALEVAIRAHLSPLPPPGAAEPETDRTRSATPMAASRHQGWPLFTPVRAQEIASVASRVEGVAWVEGVELGSDSTTDTSTELSMTRLELPRLAGLSVSVGPQRPIADIRATELAPPTGRPRQVPVPALPKDC